jgi:hypothetical protein
MNDLQKGLKTSDVSNPNINAPQTLDIRRFYRKKYRLALQIYAIVEINEYTKTQPTWAAKDILAAIVKDYDPQLPSDILLEMTQFILQEWEKVQLSKKHTALA